MNCRFSLEPEIAALCRWIKRDKIVKSGDIPKESKLSTSLLKTKLYVPSVRPEWVLRPRLIEQLNAGLDRKLSLISAPAGFGKTTLLSEWVASCGRPVAWLSLDAGDNDPVRFLSYFVAALQTIHQDIGQSVIAALQSSQPPPTQAVLTTLINEIAAVPERFVFILDDYHVIDTKAVHNGIAILLDHQPPNMHLGLASRIDLPLPLARLRARGQMTELRATNLRFTTDEAAVFLNTCIGLSLSNADLAALAARTEGWIAGLQMASLAMQARLSMQGQDDISAFVAAFTGSHRYVLDYLTEEVLNQQPENIQSFLLETSILDHLSGSLCNTVTERENGQELLEQLERANLFIVPLDDERHWYRYHHLFADLLRNRLERTKPKRVSILHRRASEWYENSGRVVEAVHHASSSGDVERTARLVEENSFAVMDRGELTTVVGWLDALPDNVVRSRPWLSISYAWALMYTGQLDEVEPRLQDAEKASDAQDLEGYIAAIRAYVLASKGHVPQAIEFARQALAYLPERDSMVRSFTAAILSSLHRFNGDFEASVQAIAEAISISQASGDSQMTILASCNLSGTLIVQGQLHKAAATLWNVLESADECTGHGTQRLPFAGLAYTGLATVLREWNDLETAERFAREGVKLSEQWGPAEVTMHGYVELAHILQVRGDENGALDAIQKAVQTARDLSAWTITPLGSTEARLHLARGDIAAASRWVEENDLSVEDEPDFQQMLNYLTLARVLIAQKQSRDVLYSLTRLLEKAESAGAMGYVIEILVLEAMAYQAQNALDSAIKCLRQALTLAEPEGYVRIFADEGAPMAALLRRAAARGIAVEYVSKLLTALADLQTCQPATCIEPLSDRELEVLRLIAAGLSNRQIGDELVLAVGTVKKHTHNIYGKLGVRSRVQAVARAKGLGILCES